MGNEVGGLYAIVARGGQIAQASGLLAWIWKCHTIIRRRRGCYERMTSPPTDGSTHAEPNAERPNRSPRFAEGANAGAVRRRRAEHGPKDHRTVRGQLCLAFPDTYTIGMSHHGLQVLYSLMNARDDWVCERASRRGPTWSASCATAGCRSTAWRRSRRWRVRRAGLHAAVRNLHEQHPDDARPGRHPAADRLSGRLSIRW